jgi:hypothetical protein
VDEPLTTEGCLSRAQEYIALAQNTSDDHLRNHLLLLAKELTELAEILDREREGR